MHYIVPVSPRVGSGTAIKRSGCRALQWADSLHASLDVFELIILVCCYNHPESLLILCFSPARRVASLLAARF